MMKLLSGVALLAGMAGLVFAQAGSSNDVKFAQEAAMGGMAEVQLGQLAIDKGTHEQVKALGHRLVDDHSRANDQLKQIAAKDNIQLPTSLDQKHQSTVNQFKNMKSGTAWDRDFLRAAVRDHTADIRAFQNQAQNGNNPDLKNFAAGTLPMLQQHLQMAQQAQNSIGMTSRK